MYSFSLLQKNRERFPLPDFFKGRGPDTGYQLQPCTKEGCIFFPFSLACKQAPKWRKMKIDDKVSRAWPEGEKWLGWGVAVDFVLIPPINPLASCNTNVNGWGESKQSLHPTPTTSTTTTTTILSPPGDARLA